MAKMTQKKLEELAAYADSYDFADEMDSGAVDDTVAPDPMVVVSVRLPQPVMSSSVAQHRNVAADDAADARVAGGQRRATRAPASARRARHRGMSVRRVAQLARSSLPPACRRATRHRAPVESVVGRRGTCRWFGRLGRKRYT